MDLKIFSWNYRGLSNPHTIDHICDVMNNKKPDFLCLVKTKVNVSRVQHFYDKINRCWDWVAIPSNGLSRGIIVL